MLSVSMFATRDRVSVDFIDLPPVSEYVPFSVVVPETVSGQFVRFVHPVNGKSAVAQVVRHQQSGYHVSRTLAEVIGVDASDSVSLYFEKVY